MLIENVVTILEGVNHFSIQRIVFPAGSKMLIGNQIATLFSSGGWCMMRPDQLMTDQVQCCMKCRALTDVSGMQLLAQDALTEVTLSAVPQPSR